ncbi:hypothetical protein B0H11DRAFT_955560 [Mycena galericulata]|nr:hypothetical protein B0H11DRAFT_955560 [Mycena galericulata]
MPSRIELTLVIFIGSSQTLLTVSGSELSTSIHQSFCRLTSFRSCCRTCCILAQICQSAAPHQARAVESTKADPVKLRLLSGFVRLARNVEVMGRKWFRIIPRAARTRFSGKVEKDRDYRCFESPKILLNVGTP